MKDSDLKVRTVCESICCEESTEVYQWILEQLEDMEPGFSLKNVRYMFGDHKIGQDLLDRLHIADTCLLRCDYWHSINQVFKEQFGAYYERILGNLKILLTGSKNECQIAYNSIKQVLVTDATMMSNLDAIHDNSKYYAGWYFREQELNLTVKGSVASEVNHASVVKTVGKGGTWSVGVHLSRLFERQIFHSKLRAEQETKRKTHANTKFKSKHTVPSHIEQDAKAIRTLSRFAYNSLFLVEFSRYIRAQSEQTNHGLRVWRCGKTFEEDIYGVVFVGNEPCKYWRRVTFNHQCWHMKKRDGGFKVECYHMRWLNKDSYSSENVTFAHFQSIRTEDFASQKSRSALTGCIDEEQFGQYSDEDVESTQITKQTAPTYREAQEMATSMVRVASNSPELMVDLVSHMKVLTQRMRNGQHIYLTFNPDHPMALTRRDEEGVRGVARHNVNAGKMNRLKSRHEHRQHHAVKKRKRHPVKSADQLTYSDMVRNNNSTAFAVLGAAKTRSCSLCCVAGHRKGSCPKVSSYAKMGKTPVPFQDKHLRYQLSERLMNERFYRNSRFDAAESVATSLPKSCKGVVIDECGLGMVSGIPKRVLRCTFLIGKMDPHPTYKHFLFDAARVVEFVTRSKNSVVIINLDETAGGGVCESAVEDMGIQQSTQFGTSVSRVPGNIYYGGERKQMNFSQESLASLSRSGQTALQMSQGSAATMGMKQMAMPLSQGGTASLGGGISVRQLSQQSAASMGLETAAMQLSQQSDASIAQTQTFHFGGGYTQTDENGFL